MDFETLTKRVAALEAEVKAMRAVMPAPRYDYVRQRQPWTAAELQMLRENYATKTPEELAAVLKRSTKSISNKASELNLVRDGTIYNVWTEADDDMVRNYYALWPTETLAKTLERSPGAVSQRASKLGVYKTAEPVDAGEVDHLAGLRRLGEVLARTTPQPDNEPLPAHVDPFARILPA